MGGMDTDQLYSVRWNEFHTSIITSFRHLLDQEDFVDVTIACDGKKFTAHKVVLSACSPYFRSLLKENPCQHPIVILRDVKRQEMEALLCFMYNGEVRINQEHLPEFLRTARSLQVRGLAEFSKEGQPSPWGSSSVVPVDKNKAGNSLLGPPYKRQRNSEQLDPSGQNKNRGNSSGTDDEESNSGDSDGSRTPNHSRSNVNRQNSLQSQLASDFLASGNNHDLHNTSISIEQQSRHSFPASISSGVSIISSLGIPGLLPGPSGIHNSSQESNYARRSIEMTRVRATDPRPCPKCGKIYRSAHTLRTHLEDKHTVCSGYRCVLCGTVAKSRNSLHSHMSRQHRGISTKDLPVQPMPSNFDPELASNLLLKAGVKISPAELRARASPTDAVTTSSGSQHRRNDGSRPDLQSANNSVCDGDDPEDLTVNSSGGHGHNNNQPRYVPGDPLQHVHMQQQQQHHHHHHQEQQNNKYPTAMDLMDNYARTGGGQSPFLPSFPNNNRDPGDKLSPYNNKAFLDSYLKALVETNPPLFYASKMQAGGGGGGGGGGGDMGKRDTIAANDAEYSSASDEDAEEEDDEDEDDDDDEDNVNNSPLPLQAGKN